MSLGSRVVATAARLITGPAIWTVFHVPITCARTTAKATFGFNLNFLAREIKLKLKVSVGNLPAHALISSSDMTPLPEFSIDAS